MDYLNNVLTTFLGIEHGGCVVVYAGSETGMWSASDKKEGKSDQAPSYAHKPCLNNLLLKIHILAH